MDIRAIHRRITRAKDWIASLALAMTGLKSGGPRVPEMRRIGRWTDEAIFPVLSLLFP
jgi:hypothetical protein